MICAPNAKRRQSDRQTGRLAEQSESDSLLHLPHGAIKSEIGRGRLQREPPPSPPRLKPRCYKGPARRKYSCHSLEPVDSRRSGVRTGTCASFIYPWQQTSSRRGAEVKRDFFPAQTSLLIHPYNASVCFGDARSESQYLSATETDLQIEASWQTSFALTMLKFQILTSQDTRETRPIICLKRWRRRQVEV